MKPVLSISTKRALSSNGFIRGGFSIIEAILSLALFALLIAAFAGIFVFSQDTAMTSGLRSRAVFVAEEGLEATRNIRDNNPSNLIAGTYGLATSSGKWIFSGSSDTIDDFTRQVIIEAVDAKRKKVTSRVNWQQNQFRTGQIDLITYLTSWQLKSGPGNWALPTTSSLYNLTNANSGNETANGISIAYADNKVYLGRTNSGGSEFYIFDVTDPSSPTMLGQLALNGSPNDIVIYGNYAYIASSDNNSELQIVNITNPATPTLDGFVNLNNGNSGNSNNDAVALDLAGSYLVVVRTGGSDLTIFNLANPANPGNPIGRAPTLASSNDVAVNGNYAFVASSNNNNELQVFDITNKSLPTVLANFDLTSGNSGDQNADALSVVSSGNYTYLGRQTSLGPEFFIFDVTNPGAPIILSSLEIGADILNMSYDSSSGYVFMVTSQTTNDFKVVNASTPSTSALLGQLNIPDSPLELVYDSTLDRVFVASSNDTSEFQVLMPQ